MIFFTLKHVNSVYGLARASVAGFCYSRYANNNNAANRNRKKRKKKTKYNEISHTLASGVYFSWMNSSERSKKKRKEHCVCVCVCMTSSFIHWYRLHACERRIEIEKKGRAKVQAFNVMDPATLFARWYASNQCHMHIWFLRKTVSLSLSPRFSIFCFSSATLCRGWTGMADVS